MIANIAWNKKLAEQYIAEIKSFGEEFLAVDIETSGLRFHPDTEICGISVSFKRTNIQNSAYYFPIKHKSEDYKRNLKKDTISKLMNFLCNEAKHLVFHNAKFDVKLIQRDYGEIKGVIHDSMIYASIQGFRKLKLSELITTLFPDMYHEKLALQNTVDEYRKYLKVDDFSEIPISLLGMYCCQDSSNTLDVYTKLYENFKEKNYGKDKEDLYQLELNLLKALIAVETFGAAIDVEYLIEQKNQLQAITDSLRVEFEVELGVKNVNSTIQISEALREGLNIALTKLTKSGKNFSTDNRTLEKIKHPAVQKLLEYRKKYKLLSTYVMGLLNNEFDGRTHTGYTQIFTKTGRLSSREPNLQNIPKKDTDIIRRAFIAPEGKALVYYDESQIELRLLAHFSKDKRMLDILNSGGDLHQATADTLGISRDEGKTINFGIIYGLQENHLANDLKISETKAGRYIKDYFVHYSGVRKYKTRLESYALSSGYVTTWLGRRVYMGEKDSYAALNYVIQGSAADLLKIVHVRCYNYISDNKLETKTVLSIHDEFVNETPENELEHIIEFKKLAEDFNNFDVPIICDVAITWTNWAENEELEI